MTQRNVRGSYFRPEHDRAADWDWLAKWQPNVIRFMVSGKPESPDSVSVDKIQRLHDTCPEATILLRVWEVDDNNFKAHDAMVADPAGEATRQLDWWAGLFDRLTGIPRNLLMAGLNNETGPEKDAALYPYTERALNIGIERNIRLGVFVFSNGRPSLPGEAEWTIDSFAKLEPLIKQNNGAIVLHQYMQPEGMYAVWTDKEGVERHDWTYLMGRDTRWPTSVPIIIGEWGIDGIIYNRHPDPKYGNSGWTNFKKDWPPSRYADEYVECIRQANPNVIAICPFISDWSDHKWQSFDLIEAYGEFLARKDKCVRDDAAPPPPAPATSMWVNAPAGARLRGAPSTNANVLQAIPFGTEVQSSGNVITNGAVWNHVTVPDPYAPGFQEGWILGALLSPTEPAKPPVTPTTGTGPTEPVKPPVGDDWSRVWPITLNIEGGLSTDRSDPGNYRPDGTFVGTRWGISALAHPTLDIVNLTKEAALDIYRRDYWQGSGADKLPWPLNLLHFDAYVQNEAAAKKFLAASGGDPDLYMAERIDWYSHIPDPDWTNFSRGWMRRCATMLREKASK